jgi:hypothetical protein
VVPSRRDVVRNFQREITTTKAPVEAQRVCIAEWTGKLTPWKYTLTTQSEAGVTFHRRYIPTWAIAVAIILFPIGLLALLVKDDASISATFTPEGEGTRVLVAGKAPGRIVKSFEQATDI